MTFDTIRLILILIKINTEINIYDFKVIIYPDRSQLILKDIDSYMATEILYKDIPDCFNCRVLLFDIDLDQKIILIKSEVLKYE